MVSILVNLSLRIQTFLYRRIFVLYSTSAILHSSKGFDLEYVFYTSPSTVSHFITGMLQPHFRWREPSAEISGMCKPGRFVKFNEARMLKNCHVCQLHKAWSERSSNCNIYWSECPAL